MTSHPTVFLPSRGALSMLTWTDDGTMPRIAHIVADLDELEAEMPTLAPTMITPLRTPRRPERAARPAGWRRTTLTRLGRLYGRVYGRRLARLLTGGPSPRAAATSVGA